MAGRVSGKWTAGKWEDVVPIAKQAWYRIADAVAAAIGTPRPAAIVLQPFATGGYSLDAFADASDAAGFAAGLEADGVQYRLVKIRETSWHPIASPDAATGKEVKPDA